VGSIPIDPRRFMIIYAKLTLIDQSHCHTIPSQNHPAQNRRAMGDGWKFKGVGECNRYLYKEIEGSPFMSSRRFKVTGAGSKCELHGLCMIVACKV
jgi:hypothetical protein